MYITLFHSEDNQNTVPTSSRILLALRSPRISSPSTSTLRGNTPTPPTTFAPA